MSLSSLNVGKGSSQCTTAGPKHPTAKTLSLRYEFPLVFPHICKLPKKAVYRFLVSLPPLPLAFCLPLDEIW